MSVSGELTVLLIRKRYNKTLGKKKNSVGVFIILWGSGESEAKGGGGEL